MRKIIYCVLYVLTCISVSLLIGCASGQSAQKATRQKASWTSAKELSFDDIFNYAIGEAQSRKDLTRDAVIDEIIYTKSDTAKEYESRLLTQYNVQEFKEDIEKKVLDWNKVNSYRGVIYETFTKMRVGEYSPQEEGFLMFTPFDNYNHINVRSPYQSYNKLVNGTYARGIDSAFLAFRPLFKLPLNKRQATEVLKSNFQIKENMTVPVMLEYTVDSCGISLDNRNRDKGKVYCKLNILKASVYEKDNIDGYTEPINVLVPVDKKVKKKKTNQEKTSVIR